MDIKDKVIDVFENRIMQLMAIANLKQLPKWDDVDVLGAECLLKEYRRITSAMHSDGEGRQSICFFGQRIKEAINTIKGYLRRR